MQTVTNKPLDKDQNSIPNQELSQQQEQFAIKIKQNDEIKILCKKLSILKEGLISQRQRKKQLEAQLQKDKNRANKYEEDNHRKQKKYKSLTAEIEQLKDQLIEQRNAKQKIYQDLKAKQQQLNMKNPEDKKASLSSGIFGIRSIFGRQDKVGNI